MAKKRKKKVKLTKTEKKVAEEVYELEKLERKGKRRFHRFLWPSFIAGIAVAILALFFEISQGGILLFACMGASAAVMIYVPKSKMNSLRTIIISYIVASLVSVAMWHLTVTFNLMFVYTVFLSIFLTTLFILMLDAFHTPAVSAALGFLLYQKNPVQLFVLVLGILILLVLVRLFEYVYHEELKLKHFYKEFKKRHYGFK